MMGEDFNLMVASNVSIDLYKVKPHKMKAKLVKNIMIQSTIGEIDLFYEPITCVAMTVDAKG